MGQAKKVKIIA